MKRLLPSAALAAAALTFSLASPAAAHADESATGVLAPKPVSTRAAAPAAVTSGWVALTTPGYVYSSSYAVAGIQVSVAADANTSSWRIYGDVAVNGVPAVSNTVIASNTYTPASISWPRAAGVGTAQFKNLRVEYYNASAPYTKLTLALPDSNVMPVRSTINPSAKIRGNKRGSKLVLRAQGWTAYQADGSMTRVAPRVKVQRLVKGKWRGYKWIKINAGGNGKIKVTQKKKYKYRIFVPTGATLEGGWTKGMRI